MKLNSKLEVKIKKKKTSFICAFRAGDTKGKLTGILVLTVKPQQGQLFGEANVA